MSVLHQLIIMLQWLWNSLCSEEMLSRKNLCIQQGVISNCPPGKTRTGAERTVHTNPPWTQAGDLWPEPLTSSLWSSMKNVKAHAIQSEQDHSQADRVNYTVRGTFCLIFKIFFVVSMVLITVNGQQPRYKQRTPFCSEWKPPAPWNRTFWSEPDALT